MDAMRACALEAIGDCRRAAEDPPRTSWRAVAGLDMLAGGLLFELSASDLSDARAAARQLREELAQRLVEIAATSGDEDAEDAVLVRGFHLATDFKSGWYPRFPSLEAFRTLRRGPGEIVNPVRSAFDLFVAGGDYYAAHAITEARPHAFVGPSLVGWRAAVKGFRHPDQAVERFADAADAFASDVFEEEMLGRGGWSSINIHLWAPYFRARSIVAELVRSPDRAAELLDHARDALAEVKPGWSDPQVICFRALVNGLAEIVTGDPRGLAVQREELARYTAVYGLDESDTLTIAFLDAASEAFAALATSPTEALTSGRLAHALDVLGRIPLLGRAEAAATRPAVGDRAFRELLGPSVTWIHRTLEGIRDEALLRQLLLRLAQARLPLYAQVRHGPLEFGKDVVALVETDRGPVLEMYQAKAGDISKRNWPKARDEIEEMFLVDIAAAQLPQEPIRREAILFFNGHLNPYVEPVVTGWLAEQESDHGRKIVLMHLDAIVAWISSGGLINEFRAATDELGLTPAP
jgi:hypothetical protein